MLIEFHTIQDTKSQPWKLPSGFTVHILIVHTAFIGKCYYYQRRWKQLETSSIQGLPKLNISTCRYSTCTKNYLFHSCGDIWVCSCHKSDYQIADQNYSIS